MKRFFVEQQELISKSITGEEYNHMKNVLRMTKGDKFIAFSNSAQDYYCTIEDINKKEIVFSINNENKNSFNPTIKIDVFQALAKGEKMELIAQKLTEIGISTIYPLYVKNCDVKLNSTKPTRLNKILVNACSQCGRSIVPTVSETITFKESLNLLKNYDLVLFANEREDSKRIYDVLEEHSGAKKIAYIIGPEGGFTEEEISLYSSLAQSVTFGKRILRTETASIYLISILNDFYRN